MAFATGVGGKLTMTATDFHVVSWSITKTSTLVEVTDSSGTGWENHKSIKKGWTFTCEAIWDDANIPDTDTGMDIADTGTLTFTLGSSAKTYSGAVVIETVVPVLNVQSDVIKVTVTGKGTGALTDPVT